MSSPYRTEIRATAALAAPLALTQLTQIAMSFVDVVMIGRLGEEALAAGVLGTTVFFTLFLVCMGVILAVSPMVAQAVGAGDRAGVGRAVRQGLWLATLLGLPLMAVLSQTERLLLLAGQEAAVSALAGGYVQAILWGTLPNLWFTALRGFAEGVARPRPILLVTVAAAGLNAGLNYVLMYGKLGLPALGLVGCGISSAVVMWAMFGLLLLFIRTDRDFRSWGAFATLRRPDPEALRGLFRLGWPIGVGFGLEAGLFTTATLLTGWVGTAALAAHQIALNAASITFMVPLGVALATTVRVGQAAGRGDRSGAERAGWAGVAVGLLFMLFAALLFWLRPGWVVWVYTGEADAPGVAEVAVGLLGIAAVFQLLDGLQVTAGGALRGLKDTRSPMVVGAVAYWGVGVTAAYGLAFGLGLGV
ncbi:MAG: MATE family efflux transporter, partial [Rhodothermales bacterium]|nr:MATE family efflux transporter [Rhodothermales bacterium]